MIVIKIKGGLGNQLFQYAFGRALALKTGKKLKFDISFYKNQNFRKFDLDKFNICFDGFAGIKEKLIFTVSSCFPKIFKNIFYLDGYWQSEKYFKEIESVIKKDLMLKSCTGIDEKLLADILNTNSVSLHARRGDYISIPSNKNYRVCDLDYYQRAIEIITERVQNPNIFIFSDDLAWVRQNLFIQSKVCFIDGNDAARDLYLMSLCKHNIIANSTFSWWAAWLNNNTQKIVIAPKAWRTDEIREELYTEYQIRI